MIRFKGKLVYHLVLRSNLDSYNNGVSEKLVSLCDKTISGSKLSFEIINFSSPTHQFLNKRLVECEHCSDAYKFFEYNSALQQLKSHKTVLQCLKAAIYKTNQSDEKQIWSISECILRLKAEYNRGKIMNTFKKFPIKLILNTNKQTAKCNMCKKSINVDSIFFVVNKPNDDIEILCLRCMASSLHYMRAYKLPSYRHTHWNIDNNRAELRIDLPLEFEEVGEGLVN